MVEEVPQLRILRLFRWARHRESVKLKKRHSTVQDAEKLTLLLVGPASNYMPRVFNSMSVRVGQHGRFVALVTHLSVVCSIARQYGTEVCLRACVDNRSCSPTLF